MKKTICLVSVVIFLFGCASSPEISPSNKESYQRLINATEIECVFTKGVAFRFDAPEYEMAIDSTYSDFPITITITIDEQTEIVTIYEQNSTGNRSTYSDFERTKWDGGLSFITMSGMGGASYGHITIFNPDENGPKHYQSFISGWFSDPDTTIYSTISGECRVIE